MNKALLLLFFTVNALYGSAQTKVGNLNISIWHPANWYSGDARLLKDNLQQYAFSAAEMNKLVNDVNKSTMLGVYYKYNPNEYYGLIPTMKFYLRRNPSTTFAAFTEQFKSDVEAMRSQVQHFSYIEPPKTILIGKHEAVYSSIRYTLNAADGAQPAVRTILLAIPLKDKFLYVTMIDSPEKSCAELYKEAISKIRLDE